MEELASTVEKLRAEMFPTLPTRLVQEIIKLETQYVEERALAIRRITTLVDAFLAREERA